MSNDNDDSKMLEAAVKAAAAARKPPPAEGRSVSDPRDVAALVLARMNMVNVKKDELTIAIKGLSDITQQLTRAYGEQLKAIAALSQRVKALEAAAAPGDTGGSGAEPPAAPPGGRTH
ncbi:hypothetical protein [Variovorax saccharolyticus]|uniref:hypothetical protein n=1 Tax=Variovorax saccharolyticus TaxID=3053516 RepID=UPI002574B136|nr:hypothetical protein [Variovorax sp. J31P216]MDM0024030.1 hypothetical protein [Variovorax sp. J31P216]